MRPPAAVWIVLLILVLLQAGCGAAATVAPAPTQGVAPEKTQEAPERPALIEKRQIVLEWPERIREKDGDVIVLSLVMDPEGRVTVTPEDPKNQVEGTPVEIPDVYETHNVMAVARLDMAGMDAWREEMREPLRPGKDVTFRWSIRADESGVYRGVVWLYLDFIPKGGGEVEQAILLSRPIEVEAVTVLGLPGWAARSVSGVGLLASTALGYPFVQTILDRWWKHRKRRSGKR